MKKYSMKFISAIAILIFSLFFAIPSFIETDNVLPNWWSKNKIKLGLDLQGGSQLLLQVETKEAIKEKIQNQLEDIRTFAAENNIELLDIKLIENKIIIKVSEDNEKTLKSFFKKTLNWNLI